MPEITTDAGHTSRELVSTAMNGLVALAMVGHSAPPNVQRILKQVMESYQEMILFAGYAMEEGSECLGRIEAKVREGQREFAILHAQEAEKHAGEVLRTMFQPQLTTGGMT